jgi:hypothetical protein
MIILYGLIYLSNGSLTRLLYFPLPRGEDNLVLTNFVIYFGPLEYAQRWEFYCFADQLVTSFSIYQIEVSMDHVL